MLDIGRKLLIDSKAAIEQNKNMDRGSGKSKDLLSLLVRANTSTELADNQRMSDEDVLARAFIFKQSTKTISTPIEVPTFLVAGHETSR